MAAARRHGALLILDEAHAVLGPELGDTTGVDVLRVGTLSKTLGSLGGFVTGPARFMDLLVNRARPYIFTTAPTPADAAAASAALGVLRSDEGDTLRARLRELIGRVAEGIGRTDHPSPILPVVIGDEQDAVAASAALLDRGLWVPAIRPPTVAPGTSRLRITLSATHTDEQVDRLVAGLADLVPRDGTKVRQCGLSGWCWCAAPVPKSARRGWPPGSWPSCGPGVGACRPASRPSRSTSVGTARASGAPPTPRPSEPPPASTRVTCATPSARTTGPWPRPLPPRPWACRRSRWPTWSRSWTGRRERVDVGVVETAGGVRSPQAEDGDVCDLVAALAPDLVLLVADAGLGTINSIRLTMDALGGGPAGTDGVPVVVVLNRFDGKHEIHRRNHEWLLDREGYRMVTLPGGESELAGLVAGD